MNIRRILMTGDTVGGVWTFTMELCRALSVRNIEVVLVALGGSSSASQQAEAFEIPGLCLLDCEFKLEWMEDPWADVEASGRWLLQLEREYRPDVVHLNSYGHGTLPWSTPVVLTAHSCVLSWWRAVKGEIAPGQWDRYRALVGQALSSVDVVTAPSCAMASALFSEYGWAPLATYVIPNGLDPSKFHTAKKENFILTAGRLWDEGKNARAIANIAHDLSWPVYLAGDKGEQLLDNCHMLGRLPAHELAAWQARASIYVMAARYEPFGLSILEAALSGCALVLGDIRSLRETWEGCALFVPPDEPAAIREAIEHLIGNACLRGQLAQRAFARALTFDAGRLASGYLDAYAEAVSMRSSECVS